MEISAALWALWLGKDFTFTYFFSNLPGMLLDANQSLM